jgi:hypothetical protein
MQDVIDYHRRESARIPRDRRDQYDESRLLFIDTLKPVGCYIGEEKWFGYVLFEFADETSILEHPFYGNAIYVLMGDWKEMVRLSKAEIRTEFSDRYIKVTHADDWRSRVHGALRRASVMRLIRARTPFPGR